MKINKIFISILTLTTSLFMVSCDGNNTIKRPQTNNKTELFSVVDTNKVDGICEYYLSSLDVTPRIEPSAITGSDFYYEIKKEDNVYIDAIINIKNLSNEAINSNDIITARIKTNSNEYTCFSVAESKDGSTLEKAALLNPLEARSIHYFSDVPKIEATDKIEIILTIHGKDFSNEFYLDSLDASSEKDMQKQQYSTENEYYIRIKKAWQQQNDYINSIDDPTVKQSVQTPESAAIMESNALLIEYPEESEVINSSLNRVLNGE